MPRPKEGKDTGFLSGHQTPAAPPGAFPSTPAPKGQGGDPNAVPYIPSSALNRVYETGAAGFPTEEFVSPEEKRIEELEGQIADIMHQLEGRTSDLAVQDGTLMVHGFQLTSTGLIPPDSMSFESWEQIGYLLFRLEGSIQWLLGDWLNYGQDVKWGDIPAIAASLGREPQSLRDYSYVARNVQLSIRIDKLTFGHHQLVAPYTPEEQVYYLRYAAEAEDKPLSIARFRAWIKEQKGERSEPALPSGSVPKPAYTALEKLDARDLSTLKPKERAAAIGYVSEMEQWLSDFKRRLGIE